VRLEPVQQPVAIANLARGGLEKSGEDVEGGRFAGAVRADEADDLSLENFEIEIGQGDEPAEMHRDLRDRQDHFPRNTASWHHWPSPGFALSVKGAIAPLRSGVLQFAIERCSAGTIPCGSRKTITIIKAP